VTIYMHHRRHPTTGSLRKYLGEDASMEERLSKSHPDTFGEVTPTLPPIRSRCFLAGKLAPSTLERFVRYA